MIRRTPSLDIRLEGDAERVRRNHDQRIGELAKMPAADLVVISNVALADGVPTPVTHGLGRVPRTVKTSTLRGAAAAGYINEIRDGSVDRTKQVLLEANDFGATVTVDVEVL